MKAWWKWLTCCAWRRSRFPFMGGWQCEHCGTVHEE